MPTVAHPTISEQKRFWEAWNPKMRDPDSLNDWCRRRAEVILQFLQSLNVESPKILDFGCGTGWLSEMLANFGPITGIDLAESAIATARARCPNSTFFAGDLFKLSLPTDHFDIVVSQEVIAHVPNQVAYIDRAADVLKPRGHLIITTPNKFVIDRADVFPQQQPGHIEKWLTIGQLKNLLRSRFEVLRSTSIIPMGNQGILRIVNSTKINDLLSGFIPRRDIDKLKEQLGLGYTLILLAQKQA